MGRGVLVTIGVRVGRGVGEGLGVCVCDGIGVDVRVGLGVDVRNAPEASVGAATAPEVEMAARLAVEVGATDGPLAGLSISVSGKPSMLRPILITPLASNGPSITMYSSLSLEP